MYEKTGGWHTAMKQYPVINLIFLSIFIGCIAFFLLSSSPVISDQMITIESSDTAFPLFDQVQYQVQDTVEKEGTHGKKLYVTRPFGYLECTEDSQVNLSIRKTYIDRVSKDKAYIKGEIRNLDDKTIDIIVITFNLFNADGDQIGNAYATIDYLEPKKTWKFSTEPITRSDFKFERYGSIFTGVYE